MTRLTLLRLTLFPLALAACGDPSAVGDQAEAVNTRIDENGDYQPPTRVSRPAPSPPVHNVCPTPALATNLTGAIAHRCPSDATDLPAPIELSTWTNRASCSLWQGHTGVVMPFCIDPTWDGKDGSTCARLEVFGVDLGTNQADIGHAVYVFHGFGSWADEQALETMNGTFVASCDPRISAGQLSSGLPPKRPPQGGNGGGGAGSCVAHEIAVDAADRARCQF